MSKTLSTFWYFRIVVVSLRSIMQVVFVMLFIVVTLVIPLFIHLFLVAALWEQHLSPIYLKGKY